jgi:hypothetical protein
LAAFEETSTMIVFPCTCGRPLRARPEAAGRRTKCPHCGAVLTIPGTPVKAAAASTVSGAGPGGSAMVAVDPYALDLDWSKVEAVAPADGRPPTDQIRVAPPEGRPPTEQIKIDAGFLSAASPADIPRPADPSVRQYRVLGQKEQGFTGKFNPAKLEETLNQYALHGWSVKSAASVKVHGHGGDHDELIVILER